MRARWLVLGLALGGCKGAPSPVDAGAKAVDAAVSPARDAAVDAAVDAAGPRLQIQLGAVAFEEEEAPDAAVVAAAPAARGPRPARAAARPARKPPRPKPAEVSAMGTIRKHMSEVEGCYAAVALKDPSVKGQIVVQWTLGRDGTPTATAIVKDTLKDKSVGRCIKERARGWRFPAPAGGVGVVTYPFNLSVQ